MIWAQMRILFRQNEQIPVKRALLWTTNMFCSTHGNHLANLSPVIYLGWMPHQQVMSIMQLENQISRARVQNQNLMQWRNHTDYLRELCGWLGIPWFWLRKNNTLQRANMGKQAQISTDRTCLNSDRCLLNIHELQTLMKGSNAWRCLLGTVSGHKLLNHRAMVTILMKHDETQKMWVHTLVTAKDGSGLTG